MKKLAFAAALLLAWSGCTQPDPAAEKAAIEGSVRGFYTAIEKYDIAGVRSYLASDFAGFEDGKPTNADYFTSQLEAFPGGSIKFNMEFVRTDPGVDLGHTIVKFDADIVLNGQKTKSITYENYILKKIDGKWLITAYHSTHLNAPKRLDPGCIIRIVCQEEVELQPGVTMEQVKDFRHNRVVPFYNALSEDIQLIPVKGLRGEKAGKTGNLYYISSQKVRDAIWPEEGKLSPEGQERFDKLKPLSEDRAKLFNVKKSTYTDWMVE
jgi:hypothetical protein